MVKLAKPVRRVATRPVRILGWLLGIRPAPGRRAAAESSIDVWQWTRPKYRWRAVVLLLVNAILFAGLGCFIFWLRTGRFVAASADQYWADWWKAFDPTREEQLTLIDFLLYPIPVSQVPWMMVIVGLVMASFTAMPILVSMLYRFPFSLIFTCIIGFVAMLPWQAITLTFCCLLARWRPLRFSFHYATALVATLPVVLYYVLATRNAPASLVLPPVELARLYVPWVLAIVAACVLMAVALMVARLVHYRPGAIAPLLAVMFAIPVVLFEIKVGRDELYYRLLEAEYGPGSKTHFVDHEDASPAIHRAAQERLSLINDPAMTLRSIEEQVALEWQLRLPSEVAMQQYEAASACDAFRERFPDSRYIPNVLYLEGRAVDMRVDQDLFRRARTFQYYMDFPNAASTRWWQELHDRFPRSPLWSFATLRLAMLDARGARVDPAISLLDEVATKAVPINGDRGAADAVGGWRGFWAKRSPSTTLGVDPTFATVVLDGRKLRHLLANNRDPQQNDLALRRLLSFDPRHPMYRGNLEQLRADIRDRYPLTPLRDNLDVLIASTDPSDSLRIDGLKMCVERLLANPRSDALPQARYELGLAYKEDDRPTEARTVFEDVVRFHPDSPWAVEASSRLASMGATARSER